MSDSLDRFPDRRNRSLDRSIVLHSSGFGKGRPPPRQWAIRAAGRAIDLRRGRGAAMCGYAAAGFGTERGKAEASQGLIRLYRQLDRDAAALLAEVRWRVSSGCGRGQRRDWPTDMRLRDHRWSRFAGRGSARGSAAMQRANLMCCGPGMIASAKARRSSCPTLRSCITPMIFTGAVSAVGSRFTARPDPGFSALRFLPMASRIIVSVPD